MPGGAPASGDPPVSSRDPVRGRGEARFSNPAPLEGGTKAAREPDEDSEAEKEMLQAYADYRREDIKEGERLKNFMLDKFGKKEYSERFGRDRKKGKYAEENLAASIHTRELGKTFGHNPKRGVLMRTITSMLASAEENRVLSALLSEQAAAKEGSTYQHSQRTVVPAEVLAQIDAIEETDQRKYNLKRFRIRASHHLAMRRQQDRESGKYLESQCTLRHRSRIRSIEYQAYQIGALEPIPKEEREVPKKRENPDEKRTAYSKKHKADRRMLSMERQKLAVRISLQVASATVGLVRWPEAAGEEVPHFRDFVHRGGMLRSSSTRRSL